MENNTFDDEKDIEIRKIDYSDENISLFCSELSKVNWDVLNAMDNVNVRYDCFFKLYTDVYNRYFSGRIKKKKINTKRKPWISKDIIKLSKRKHVLYRKYLKSRSVACENAYKRCRNDLSNLIREKKREYYHMRFANVQGNMKETWNVINQTLNRNTFKTIARELEINGNTITDEQEIVNEFNNHFTSIGMKLSESINNNMRQNSFSEYMTGHFEKSLFLHPARESDILNIVLKLDTSKGPGYDNVHPKVLKKCIHIVLTPLCNIINLAIEHGIFPDALKIARVTPVFKSGNTSLLNNYRPISVLSIFSKIFEKIIYNKLIVFIENNNILFEKQFGFRKNNSTCHALLNLVDRISQAFECNKFLISVFLDLSKAFDCIDFNILFHKLYFYGLRGTPLLLLKSYLLNRKQYVSIGNNSSEYSNIHLGVPQGSNLGPLLFLLYINDLPSVSSILSFILFADDTTIFLSGNDPFYMNFILNTEITKIYQWFLANKLFINYEKTNYVIFKTRNKHIDDSAIQIRIANKVIKQANQVRFLGVILDENMAWKYHIDYICKKISRVTGVLNRVKKILPLRILVSLYNTMILPHLNYCLIIWGGCASYLFERIYLIQKRAIRVITNSFFRAHTQILFFKLKILKLSDLYETQVILFMYKYLN